MVIVYGMVLTFYSWCAVGSGRLFVKDLQRLVIMPILILTLLDIALVILYATRASEFIFSDVSIIMLSLVLLYGLGIGAHVSAIGQYIDKEEPELVKYHRWHYAIKNYSGAGFCALFYKGSRERLIAKKLPLELDFIRLIFKIWAIFFVLVVSTWFMGFFSISQKIISFIMFLIVILHGWVVVFYCWYDSGVARLLVKDLQKIIVKPILALTFIDIFFVILYAIFTNEFTFFYVYIPILSLVLLYGAGISVYALAIGQYIDREKLGEAKHRWLYPMVKDYSSVGLRALFYKNSKEHLIAKDLLPELGLITLVSKIWAISFILVIFTGFIVLLYYEP